MPCSFLVLSVFLLKTRVYILFLLKACKTLSSVLSVLFDQVILDKVSFLMLVMISIRSSNQFWNSSKPRDRLLSGKNQFHKFSYINFLNLSFPWLSEKSFFTTEELFLTYKLQSSVFVRGFFEIFSKIYKWWAVQERADQTEGKGWRASCITIGYSNSGAEGSLNRYLGFEYSSRLVC